MAKFTPVVDAEKVYGEGDWRPLLGDGPRNDGWKYHILGKQSMTSKLRGFMYPAFDWTLDTEDKAFRESVGACWTNAEDSKNARHFAPNSFALPLLIYPFLGPTKEHWVSPRNLVNMLGTDTLYRDDARDAFDDLNKWIRLNKEFSQAKKDFFLKSATQQEDALVPGRQMRYFSLNCVMDKDNGWHDAVVAFTASAFSYIIEQLRWSHRHADGPPRDPNWPQYMLGDPTDVNNALEWYPDKHQVDAKDHYETNVIKFTERVEFLDPNPKTHKITPEMLRRRFLLPDPKNWNIPTYEEQVAYMMHSFDKAVTADMIRAACGQRCRDEIPHSRPESMTVSTKAAADEAAPARRTRETPTRESYDDQDPMAAVTGGGQTRMAPSAQPPMPRREDPPPQAAPAAAPVTRSEPPRQAAPVTRSEPPRTAAAAAPTNPSASYWAGAAGGKSSKKTVAELQAMVDAGEYEGIKVMTSKDVWVSLADSGLVEIPPPFEVPSDVPSIPEDDEPPGVPAGAPPGVPSDSAPVAGGGCTLEQMRRQLFADEDAFNALPEAKRAEALALVKEAWEATDHGRNDNWPEEIGERLMQLID